MPWCGKATVCRFSHLKNRHELCLDYVNMSQCGKAVRGGTGEESSRTLVNNNIWITSPKGLSLKQYSYGPHFWEVGGGILKESWNRIRPQAVKGNIHYTPFRTPTISVLPQDVVTYVDPLEFFHREFQRLPDHALFLHSVLEAIHL